MVAWKVSDDKDHGLGGWTPWAVLEEIVNTHTHHIPPPPHHPGLVQCQLTGEMECLQYVMKAMDPIFSKESVVAYKKSLVYNFKGITDSQKSR